MSFRELLESDVEFKAQIRKLIQLEKKILKIQLKTWELESDWEDIHDKIKDLPEWKAYTKNKGLSSDYDINDLKA